MEFDLTLRDTTDEEVQSMVPIDPHNPPCGSLSDTECEVSPTTAPFPPPPEVAFDLAS